MTGNIPSPPLILSRDGYLHRMEHSPAFRLFDIVPKWRPGEGDIEGFCHDEVIRQGHDPRVEQDGGCRVRWMVDAWTHASFEFEEAGKHPTVKQIRVLGMMVERYKNRNGFRSGWVRVGTHVAPDPAEVPRLLDVLVGANGMVFPEQGRGSSDPSDLRLTADDWYLEFERIHPFIDGNGRTGKILHNWFLHSLHEPVLVADYFGGGNP